MIYRLGQLSDFQHIETFVWQAIFPAYDHPDLNEAQRSSNDAIVETARAACTDALQHPDKWVLVAYDDKRKELAGYSLVHQVSRSEAQLLQFIVARRHWSKGVAQELFSTTTQHLAACNSLFLSLHYYNARALAFFEKLGFVPTEALDQEAIIPQIWLAKDLAEVLVSAAEAFDFSPEAETDERSQEVTESSPAVPEEDWKIALEALLGTSFEEDTAALLAEEAKESQETPESEPDPADFTFDYTPKKKLPSWPKAKPERSRPASPIKPISFEFVWEEEAPLNDLFSKTSTLEEDTEEPSILLDATGGSALEVEWDVILPKGGASTKTNIRNTENRNTRQEKPQKKAVASEASSRSTASAKLSIPNKMELRRCFRDILYDFANRLFGSGKASKYVELSTSVGFELLLESALNTLQTSLESVNPLSKNAQAQIDKRLRYGCEELAEYLIVGFGTALHARAFPEAVLRYQGSLWGKMDLFGMVNTYLDLEQEYEVVYRDFITMPKRKLRNATQNFLLARRDEVIYFIVDQSLLGSASNGFACTNRSLYWKNPLQPNHAVYFSDLKSIKMASSCLWINGHFFDAGYSINLKLALLLEKIRRMQP